MEKCVKILKINLSGLCALSSWKSTRDGPPPTHGQIAAADGICVGVCSRVNKRSQPTRATCDTADESASVRGNLPRGSFPRGETQRAEQIIDTASISYSSRNGGKHPSLCNLRFPRPLSSLSHVCLGGMQQRHPLLLFRTHLFSAWFLLCAVPSPWR